MLSQEYRTNRHSCYSLKYHLVVVTKYRHLVIDEAIFERLSTIANNIFENKNKCKVISINYEADHIHILLDAVPQICLSIMINSFKTVSSRLIRKEFARQIAPFYWKPIFWSSSYFISSVGDTNIDTVKAYIAAQSKN